MSCHPPASSSSKKPRGNGRITIALAGNANVGKSVLFNQLTGSSQIIGNWPGKTVEKAEGTLKFEGEEITAIDLPGIYSFSTFGMEELVSREYIALEHPDVVVNVVDASILERNLFFTLQLIEMDAPLVICLNQVDEAKKKGIVINREKLEQALGAPVVPTVGIRGEGVYDLTKTAVAVARNGGGNGNAHVRYGAEIEERISRLDKEIQAGEFGLEYPSRWIAIKLLENDPEIKKMMSAKSESIVKTSEALAAEISSIHNEPCFAVIAAERYSLASRIASEVQQQQSEVESTFSEKLEWVTTHKMFGYLTSAGVIAGLLLWTFNIGGLLSNILSSALALISPLDPQFSGSVEGIIWNGVYGGFVAGVTLVLPYVIPFYLMLALIEDSGILTGVAFMMDSAMHKIGLHGKALIPMILGYGCNVPAIAACRIMETKRERLLATYVITFAPCAARTIVILGLVAAFVNHWWALMLYAFDIALIFIMGRISSQSCSGPVNRTYHGNALLQDAFTVNCSQTDIDKDEILDLSCISPVHYRKRWGPSFVCSRRTTVSEQRLLTSHRCLAWTPGYSWSTVNTRVNPKGTYTRRSSSHTWHNISCALLHSHPVHSTSPKSPSSSSPAYPQ